MSGEKTASPEPPCKTGDNAAGRAKTQVSLWERVEHPSPPPRTPTLSHARIAAVAVKIADAEGIDAVTMRRIATELEVAPMAAYRYVSGKDEVLELMVDLVHADLTAADAPGDWRETMRLLALRTRDLVLAHPWLSQLGSPRAMFAPTPNRLAVVEQALVSLEKAGLRPDLSMMVFDTVNSYVHGAAYTEVAMRMLIEEHGLTDTDGVKASMAPGFVWLVGSGRYPAFLRSVEAGGRPGDPAGKFESGLECVLDGIAARMRI
ncbi:TetR/AcrR family transcriptional regulator [Streptomyces sp. NPDC059639]|uniref:TetR/AcrR family transcriptional regulator n=1 Tax=Streptomyces sp. NPDC059639 TaxID=3346891 RepID=UPI00367E7E8B